MKVALLVPGGVDRPGTARAIPCLLALIERLAALGDEVHVFQFQHPGEPGSVCLLGATVVSASGRASSLRTLRAMLREHRRARFDVVHAICYFNRTGALGAAASRLMCVPLVLTLVDGEVARLPEIGFGGLVGWRGRSALRLAARRASVVTTQSDFMRSLAARAGIAARTVVLGVDLRSWPPSTPRPRADAAPLRLRHVGRLTAVKDQATLLSAMALLRRSGVRFTLDLVGEGALAPALEEAVTGLGLGDAVRIIAPMPHAELRTRFEHADLLVMSSLHESGPMVALEAAVAGVPAVGTAVGYLADWNGWAALAVPPRRPELLAAAIAALAGDEPRRLALAAAAQAKALESDADRTAQTVRGMYREVAR